MAEKTVGRVSVRISPDTTTFHEEAEKKLNVEEKRLPSLEVELTLEISQESVSKATAGARAARQAIENTVGDIELKVDLDSEGSIAAALVQIEREMANLRKISIPVGLNEADLTAAKALLEERLGQIRIEPELSTPGKRLVETELAVLTRKRDVEINPTLKKGSLAALNVISVLSGWQALRDNIDEAHDALFGMFTNMTQIMALTPLVLGLSGAFFSATANVVGLVGSLAQALPILLALPGVAIGVGAMAVAFADFSTVLPNVVAQFKALGPLISGAFWANALTPINQLASVVFPQLQAGVKGTGDALGTFFGALAGAIQTVLAGGTLQLWFSSLNSSIQIFASYTPALAEIFRIFGEIGSTLLPPLAKIFGELADRFAAFMNNLVTGAGGLGAFVNQTLNAFSGLIEFVLSIGNVFAAVFSAASAAGAATFQSLSDHLNTFAEFLRRPDIAQGMTNLFGAAFEMFDKFFTISRPAFEDFLKGIGGVLTEVLPKVGEVLGQVAAAISSIFSDESALAGIKAFISGILTGVQAVLPAIAPLANLIASLGPTLGTLATNIGNIFGALTPSFAGLMSSLTPIINLLGGGLAAILEKVSPLLTTIGETLTQVFTDIGPMLDPIIGALLQLVTAIVPPLQAFISAIAPLLTTVIGIIAPIITNILTAIAPMLVSIVQAATPILGLVTTLLGYLGPVLIPVISLLGEVIASSLQFVVEGAVKVIRGLLDVLVGIITFVVGVFTGDWGKAWDGIQEIFKGVWDAIVGIVMFVFGFTDARSIWGIIKGGWEGIVKLFTKHTDDIKTKFTEFGDNIVGAIKTAFDFIVDLFTKKPTEILQKVAEFGDEIVKKFRDIGTKIWDGVVTALEKVVDFLFTFFPEQAAKLQTKMIQFGKDLIQGLVDGIKAVAHKVIDTMKSYVLDKLPDFVKDFFGINSPSKMFHGFGESLMQGLAGGIKSESDVVMGALKGVMGDVKRVKFTAPTGSLGVGPSAFGTSETASTGNTINYYAAPGNSLDSQEDLFDALSRARAFGW